ncbi:MAG: NUDIX hydrolase, partial [Rhizobiaceae bacterium]
MNAPGNQKSSTVPLIGMPQLRTLARDRLKDDQDAQHGDHRLNPEASQWVVKNAIVPAAVLIPFIERSNELQVIFTKRTAQLKSHSGQIAFPGGKIDPQDHDARHAAMREAHEEIRLEPQHVEIIGNLPDYVTGSGYRISPVLALVDSAAQMEPNPEEVEYIFEVPLEFLMNTDNHHMGSRELNGKHRYFYEMPFGKHH